MRWTALRAPMALGASALLASLLCGALSATSAAASPRRPGSHRDPFVVKSIVVPSATDQSALVTVTFSSPLRAGSPLPTITPAVAGSWQMPTVYGAHGTTMLDTKTIQFFPVGPFVPDQRYTVNVPTGRHGVESITKQRLGTDPAATWTLPASTERLQELLAQLGYLPLSWTATSPTLTPDLANAQPGTFAWRWSMPEQLTSLWVEGQSNVITTGAVMQFEAANDMTTDGIAGPDVWAALLRDVMESTGTDTAPWDWVLVSQSPLPENQVIYSNGVVVESNPVNTGIAVAPTADGTFPVYEHLVSTTMTGTNPDGTHYSDPGILWVSYFNGGDALHEFPRASYGFPQSLGCVESPMAAAAAVFPYTPIGTLVTVQGTAGA